MNTAGRDPTVVEVEKGAGRNCVKDGGIVPANLIEGLGVGRDDRRWCYGDVFNEAKE